MLDKLCIIFCLGNILSLFIAYTTEWKIAVMIWFFSYPVAFILGIIYLRRHPIH